MYNKYFEISQLFNMKNDKETPLLLSAISDGLVVKNYRELCGLLQQPVLSGSSKIAQLKVFAQYLDYSPIEHTNKFIINNIYQEPLQKYRKPSKIAKMTSLKYYSLMLDLCQDISEDNSADTVITVYRTQKQLHLLLGICNEEYYNNKHFISEVTPTKKQQYSESIFANLPRQHVTDFYKEVDERGRSHINRLIDNFVTKMHKEYLIEAKKTYLIDTGNGLYMCSDDQHTEIRGAVRNTLNLDKYQIKSADGLIEATEQNIFLRGRTEEFYADVLRDSWVVSEGITSIYSTWQFRFTPDLISQLDRFAEIHNIVKADVLPTLTQKSVKYHDMRTLKEEAKKIANGKSCLLPEEYLEEWLDTHYRPSRQLLRTLIQTEDTK